MVQEWRPLGTVPGLLRAGHLESRLKCSTPQGEGAHFTAAEETGGAAAAWALTTGVGKTTELN